jgi:hypothetical protein
VSEKEDKDECAFNWRERERPHRKLVFTGSGTYRSDVSNEVSHVLTNFFTKL